MEHSENTISDSDSSREQSSHPSQPPIAPEPPISAKRRIWPWALTLIVVLIVVAAVVSGIKRGKADAASKIEVPQIATIKTATARLGPIGYYVQALGTVTPLATVTVTSRTTRRPL